MRKGSAHVQTIQFSSWIKNEREEAGGQIYRIEENVSREGREVNYIKVSLSSKYKSILYLVSACANACHSNLKARVWNVLCVELTLETTPKLHTVQKWADCFLQDLTKTVALLAQSVSKPNHICYGAEFKMWALQELSYPQECHWEEF